MGSTILQLVLVGAQIFQEERKRYYENKVKNLQKKIFEVADSDFYQKDMEAKGKAERELLLEEDALAKEMIAEAKGTK